MCYGLLVVLVVVLIVVVSLMVLVEVLMFYDSLDPAFSSWSLVLAVVLGIVLVLIGYYYNYGGVDLSHMVVLVGCLSLFVVVCEAAPWMMRSNTCNRDTMGHERLHLESSPAAPWLMTGGTNSHNWEGGHPVS